MNMNDIDMNDKRKALAKLMSNYVDKNNCIDLTTFRSKHMKEYSLIPYYYGSIKNALEQNGWVKVVHLKRNNNSTVSFKDKLAFYALHELRRNHTLEEIGAQFGGITKSCVHQMYIALEKNINK